LAVKRTRDSQLTSWNSSEDQWNESGEAQQQVMGHTLLLVCVHPCITCQLRFYVLLVSFRCCHGQRRFSSQRTNLLSDVTITCSSVFCRCSLCWQN